MGVDRSGSGAYIALANGIEPTKKSLTSYHSTARFLRRLSRQGEALILCSLIIE